METLVSFVIQILKEIYVCHESIKHKALVLQTQDGADCTFQFRDQWLFNVAPE